MSRLTVIYSDKQERTCSWTGQGRQRTWALPFLGAGVVVLKVTRSVSEAEEPTRRDFLAHASGYCARRSGRATTWGLRVRQSLQYTDNAPGERH